MSPVLRRTTRTTRSAGLALALALGLSGCGAGLRAQTYQERTTSDSTNEAIGALAVRHLRILPPSGGEFPTYKVGQDARAAAIIVNRGTEDDRLVSITSDAATRVEVIGPDGRPAPLVVPAQQTATAFAFVLRGLTRELRPATYVEMQLTFAENGTETMLVPVETTGTPGPAREGYHPAPLDSAGDPIVEEEHSTSEEGGESQSGAGSIGAEGQAGGSAQEEETGGSRVQDGTTGSTSGSQGTAEH